MTHCKRIHNSVFSSVAALFVVALPGCFDDNATSLATTTTGDEGELTTTTAAANTTAQDSTGDQGSIDAYILGLGHLTLPPQQPPVPKECEGNDCLEDTLECTYIYYNTTEHFGDFVAFQPNSATLWPGSIVRGADAKEGLLTPISLARAPLKFSVSLENLNGSPVGEMHDPTLSEFREQRNMLLQQGVEGKAPASMYFEMSEVYSEASLSLLLKTDVSWGKENGNKIAGMFDFKTESSERNLMVTFVQSYYTIDVDTPATPSDLFSPEVTLEEVQQFVDVDNPPMYVQSVNFGRRMVFSLKTSHNLEKLKTAFTAAINSVVDVNFEAGSETKELLENLDMKVLVLGGAGESSVKAISGFQGLVEAIEDGADYGKASPGAPIGYTLSYLDNSGVKFAYTTDFAECQAKSVPGVELWAQNLHFSGNGQAAFKGNVKYRVWAENSEGESCEFISTGNGTQKIGDGDTINIEKPCSIYLEKPQNAWVQMRFEAKEENKVIEAARKFDFTGDWPSQSAEIGDKDGNLHAQLKFSIKPLD